VAGRDRLRAPNSRLRKLGVVTTVRPALDAALRHTIALRTEAIFRATGAYGEGHFELDDGRHADARLVASRLFEDPAATGELCGLLAEHGRGRDREPLVDRVVARPTIDGAVLAFEIARQLGVLSLSEDPLRFESGERLLVVEDVMTSSRTLAAILPTIEAAGGDIVECVALVDLTGDARATVTSATTGRVYPLRSLWQIELANYEPGVDTCPRCGEGAPLVAPRATLQLP
jgi:orotate phosphoribosyltransferase